MKEKYRIIVFAGALVLLSYCYSQPPDGYYDAAFGKKKDALKTALKEIILSHTVRSYNNLWTDFKSTDNKGNNIVWDMYSDVPDGTPAYIYYFTSDQCGNYSGEGSCYNREHSFPKSWFSDASPMYTDLFHIYPTDGYVNGRRGNDPFGEVGNARWTSTNGSKSGASSFAGYTGNVFEPIDAYKGDFARTYFYMVTCYEDRVSNWSSAMLSGDKYPAFTSWAMNLLLKWSRDDNVSAKEYDRNNAIYRIQNNRNPYIDYPQLAEYVWGDSVRYAFNPDSDPSSVLLPEQTEEPALVYAWQGVLYVANSTPGAIISVYTVYGQLLFQHISTSDIYTLALPPLDLIIVRITDARGYSNSYKIRNK